MRFSVIIATYNRKDLVKYSIESVIQQSFKDYEIIVVDDGSTDNTKEFLEKTFGSKINLVRQTNLGSERAYLFGSSFAKGEYLAFLDSDDLFLPSTLATYDKVIKFTQQPPVVIGSMVYFKNLKEVDPYKITPNKIELMIYTDYFSKDISIGLAQSRILIRRDVFFEANRIHSNQNKKYRLNDYRLMFIAGTYGPCIIILKPITVAYRQHDSQASKTVERMAGGVLELINDIYSITFNFREFPNLRKLAFLGGPIIEWSKKSLKSKRYPLVILLLAKGWPMILAAAIRHLENKLVKKGGKLIIEHY